MRPPEFEGSRSVGVCRGRDSTRRSAPREELRRTKIRKVAWRLRAPAVRRRERLPRAALPSLSFMLVLDARGVRGASRFRIGGEKGHRSGAPPWFPGTTTKRALLSRSPMGTIWGDRWPLPLPYEPQSSRRVRMAPARFTSSVRGARGKLPRTGTSGSTRASSASFVPEALSGRGGAERMIPSRRMP